MTVQITLDFMFFATLFAIVFIGSLSVTTLIDYWQKMIYKDIFDFAALGMLMSYLATFAVLCTYLIHGG